MVSNIPLLKAGVMPIFSAMSISSASVSATMWHIFMRP